MDWGEFFLVQAVAISMVLFGFLALHAGGWRHSKVAAAIDRNPFGHFILLLMAMSRLKHQDAINEVAAQKLPTLVPGLEKIRRGFALVLAIIVFAGATLAELMFIAEQL